MVSRLIPVVGAVLVAAGANFSLSGCGRRRAARIRVKSAGNTGVDRVNTDNTGYAAAYQVASANDLGLMLRGPVTCPPRSGTFSAGRRDVT
jgi:hypothetical protein